MLNFLKTVTMMCRMMWEIATMSDDDKAVYKSEFERVLGKAQRTLAEIEDNKREIEDVKRETYQLLRRAQEVLEQNKRISSSLPTDKTRHDALPLDP